MQGMSLFEMSNTAKQLYELLESGDIDEQILLDTMESIGASAKLEEIERSVNRRADKLARKMMRLQWSSFCGHSITGMNSGWRKKNETRRTAQSA